MQRGNREMGVREKRPERGRARRVGMPGRYFFLP